MFKRLTEAERLRRDDSFFLNGTLHNPEDFMPDEAAVAYREALSRRYAGISIAWQREIQKALEWPLINVGAS